jgi:hypothetical protein
MGLFDWLFSRKSLAPAKPQVQPPDDSDTLEQAAAVLRRMDDLQQCSADDTGKEKDFTAATTIPVARWLRIKLPNCPSFVGYTYVDQQAGLSAKGSSQRDPQLAIAPVMTVRLPWPGASWRVLDDEERNRLSLPLRPPWVEIYYGPQPEPDSLWGAWREHPRLERLFSPDYPDDLQVLVHDGGLGITKKRPELVWVTVTGMEGEVFRGRVLNQPYHLQTVSRGSEIRFVMPEGSEHPIMATEKAAPPSA